MTKSLATQDSSRRRIASTIVVYPMVMLLIDLALNLKTFGVSPALISLPSQNVVFALALAGALLVIYHT